VPVGLVIVVLGKKLYHYEMWYIRGKLVSSAEESDVLLFQQSFKTRH
jgi:hypothetical protein